MLKILLFIFFSLLLGGCMNHDEKFDIELISNKGKKLKLSLKKCFFDMKRLESGPFSYVYLKFPLYTFSGNYTGNYQCLKKSNELKAILEISQSPNIDFGDNIIKNSKGYWLRALNLDDKYLLERRGNISIYKFGVNKNVIVIDDSFNSDKINMFIFYVPYSSFLRGQKNGFTDKFNILSILNDDFKIKYDVYSSNFTSDNEKIYGVDVNTGFIDDFRDLIQNQRDILDKPEIINKFVENNERVISFIKANSQGELK